MQILYKKVALVEKKSDIKVLRKKLEEEYIRKDEYIEEIKH